MNEVLHYGHLHKSSLFSRGHVIIFENERQNAEIDLKIWKNEGWQVGETYINEEINEK